MAHHPQAQDGEVSALGAANALSRRLSIRPYVAGRDALALRQGSEHIRVERVSYGVAVTAAVLGVVGVLLGGLLTAQLTTRSARRDRRAEALADLVAATARVIVAHERLYEMAVERHANDAALSNGFSQRIEALAQWRVAHARVRVLVADDELEATNRAFKGARAAGTRWVREYFADPAHYRVDEGEQRVAWKAMHDAHDQQVAIAGRIVQRDSRVYRLVL